MSVCLRRRRPERQKFKVIFSYIVGKLGHMRPCLKQGTTKNRLLNLVCNSKGRYRKKELESYFSLPMGKQPGELECVLALDIMPLSLLLPKRIYFSFLARSNRELSQSTEGQHLALIHSAKRPRSNQ